MISTKTGRLVYTLPSENIRKQKNEVSFYSLYSHFNMIKSLINQAFYKHTYGQLSAVDIFFVNLLTVDVLPLFTDSGVPNIYT